jgi:hypothetical protein
MRLEFCIIEAGSLASLQRAPISGQSGAENSHALALPAPTRPYRSQLASIQCRPWCVRPSIALPTFKDLQWLPADPST